MLTSRLFGGTFVTSWPCSRITPWVGSSKPAIIRMVVVLPQPDGPSREKNSPSRMSRSIPATPDSSIAGRAEVSLAVPRVAAAVADVVLLDAVPWDAVPAGVAPAPVSDPARAGTCLSVISGGYPSSHWMGSPLTLPAGRPGGASVSLPGTSRSSQVHSSTSTESVVLGLDHNEFSYILITVPGRAGRRRSSAAVVAHDVLDPGVVLESVHR